MRDLGFREIKNGEKLSNSAPIILRKYIVSNQKTDKYWWFCLINVFQNYERLHEHARRVPNPTSVMFVECVFPPFADYNDFNSSSS